MASEVSICNQALSWLAGASITSLDDESSEARLCKANYANLRDAVLSEGSWTFATTRFTPAAESSAPAYGYAFAFPVPTTILTVLEVQKDGNNANGFNTLDWRMEEDKILCDEQIIYVKAIKQVTDPNKFHPLFTQALAARIAAEIAIPLTNSRTLQADMFQLYERKMQNALAIENSQGKSDRIRSAANYVRIRNY